MIVRLEFSIGPPIRPDKQVGQNPKRKEESMVWQTIRSLPDSGLLAA